MESIILFALIAIGSTVFSAIKQEAEKQRKAQMATKTSIPNRQPEANINIKQSSPNIDMVKKTRVQYNVSQADASNNNMCGRDIQTKNKEDYVFQKSSNKDEEAINNGGTTFVNFSELQRSIIMAEVLGKPKALKKGRI